MNSNTETTIELSKEFSETNLKIRKDWEIGRTAARSIANNLNKLVEILHVEHPDWTINKIAQQIWVMNSDLEGFSRQTIYNNLDGDNKELVNEYKARKKELQHKPSSALEEFRQTKGTIVQNNDTEEKFQPLETNVTEESSSKSLPSAHDLKEAEDYPDTEETFTEEPDTIYDKQFVENLIKENAEQKDLLQNLKKEKVESSMSKSYTSEYSIEFSDEDLSSIKNNAGVCPLIVTSYPEKKHSIVRFDRLGLHNKKKR